MCSARILNFEIPDLTDGTKESLGTQPEVPARADNIRPYSENCEISRRGGYQPPAFELRAERPFVIHCSPFTIHYSLFTIHSYSLPLVETA